MIDTANGGEFVSYITLDRDWFLRFDDSWSSPRDQQIMWERMKEQLVRKFYDDVFIQFMNGGWYTFSLMFVQEEMFESYAPQTKLGVVGKIFKVQEQTHVMEMVTFDYSLPMLKKEWKILCAGCGNVFTPDGRGGCSACGAPADWIKNWTLEAK